VRINEKDRETLKDKDPKYGKVQHVRYEVELSSDGWQRLGDLERAVGAARAAARPGDVILLSPAAASYDQYRDFEARGDRFRDLVREA